MKIGYKELIERAEDNIESISVNEAEALIGKSDTVFVDIRDVRELQREGKLPGAIHAPRGMLEFWVDPESPYHREIFADDKKFIFYLDETSISLWAPLKKKTWTNNEVYLPY